MTEDFGIVVCIREGQKQARCIFCYTEPVFRFFNISELFVAFFIEALLIFQYRLIAFGNTANADF